MDCVMKEIYQALKHKVLLVFLWSLKYNNLDFRRLKILNSH
ncbi:unnamed protein product, partial [Vitis vinifera]|uniref:Uncharacterized protein n=1 Tax=Vitis vinifera TaxID=29760 RepID=D7T067_VITVI